MFIYKLIFIIIVLALLLVILYKGIYKKEYFSSSHRIFDFSTQDVVEIKNFNLVTIVKHDSNFHLDPKFANYNRHCIIRLIEPNKNNNFCHVKNTNLIKILNENITINCLYEGNFTKIHIPNNWNGLIQNGSETQIGFNKVNIFNFHLQNNQGVQSNLAENSGALCCKYFAYNAKNNLVKNCSFTGNLCNQSPSGGLFGSFTCINYSELIIENCNVTVTEFSLYDSGGLLGTDCCKDNSNLTIKECKIINNYNYLPNGGGGFTGKNFCINTSNAVFDSCAYEGKISYQTEINNNGSGGFCGVNSAIENSKLKIILCYSKGDIESNNCGGFMTNNVAKDSEVIIGFSYFMGNIDNYRQCGGFIGNLSCLNNYIYTIKIYNSFFIGNITLPISKPYIPTYYYVENYSKSFLFFSTLYNNKIIIKNCVSINNYRDISFHQKMETIGGCRDVIIDDMVSFDCSQQKMIIKSVPIDNTKQIEIINNTSLANLRNLISYYNVRSGNSEILPSDQKILKIDNVIIFSDNINGTKDALNVTSDLNVNVIQNELSNLPQLTAQSDDETRLKTRFFESSLYALMKNVEIDNILYNIKDRNIWQKCQNDYWKLNWENNCNQLLDPANTLPSIPDIDDINICDHVKCANLDCKDGFERRTINNICCQCPKGLESELSQIRTFDFPDIIPQKEDPCSNIDLISKNNINYMIDDNSLEKLELCKEICDNEECSTKRYIDSLIIE
jgi:hypothetical protein